MIDCYLLNNEGVSDDQRRDMYHTFTVLNGAISALEALAEDQPG